MIPFARQVTTTSGDKVLEGLTTVPILDEQDIIDPGPAIAEAAANPKRYQSLATTNLLAEDSIGKEQFAVCFTTERYDDDIRQGDYLFFATDLLPAEVDFCFFRRKHAKKTSGRKTGARKKSARKKASASKGAPSTSTD